MLGRRAADPPAAAAAALRAIVLMGFLPQVFQRTMRRSGEVADEEDGEADDGMGEAERTIRSLRIMSLTFPTRGTRPHATGAVQRAA